MSYPSVAKPSREGPLWGLSLVVSLVLNTVIFALLAWVAPRTAEVTPEEPPAGSIATISLILPAPQPPMAAVDVPPPAAPATAGKAGSEEHAAPAILPSATPRFGRTSPDQESAEPPVAAVLAGERNTRATSDRPPDPAAPAGPSQDGVASSFDGTQAPPPDAAPAMPVETAATASPTEPTAETTRTAVPSPAMKAEPLVRGTQSVDVPVPGPGDATTPPPVSPPVIPSDSPKSATPPAPAHPELTAEQKARLSGSLSRAGAAAQDVIDTPLGRYQASINRAVEGVWLQNCKRYQQYISAGCLTMRFVVGQDGHIRTVETLDAVDCSDLQRNFTINAIHDAKLPKMPADLRKKLGNDPLEQILIFYF